MITYSTKIFTQVKSDQNVVLLALPGMVEGHGLRPMDLMAVDTGEDEWQRLHDVRLTSNVLEYVGRGKCEKDVGLAQARTPIGTRNHYFEIEIVDPGYNCYIAIGLAKKNYPKNRHPGWNRGSIGYHADDGKVRLFVWPRTRFIKTSQ